jgi:hypothetical protein
MMMKPEEIRENIELGEDWRPKAGIREGGDSRSGARPGFLSWLFEALFPLWMYLIGAAGVAAFVAVLYYICEVLPKR